MKPVGEWADADLPLVCHPCHDFHDLRNPLRCHDTSPHPRLRSSQGLDPVRTARGLRHHRGLGRKAPAGNAVIERIPNRMHTMNFVRLWVLAIATLAIMAATHTDPPSDDDARQNGWQNQSWAAVDSIHSTTEHSGTQSIRLGATSQYTLAATSTNTVTYAATTFVHPGALDSRGELDFVKAKIQAKAQPWRAEFDRLLASSYATRTPHGKTTIHSSSGDAELSRDDAIASYTQALLWYYSGNAIYANRSIAILNSWTNLQSFTAGSDQDKLQAGWIGAVFAPAAEIMRGYSGWTTNDIAHLQAMFKRAFYPQLNRMSTWNGNVDLTQIDAMMAIAVFNEDTAEFNAGLTRLAKRLPSYIYLTSAGTPPPIAGDGGNVQNFWFNPTLWTNGLTQETCRDNGHHTQFALGSALHAAETAWHQGVDVYTANTRRFTEALELMASQFLTGSMQGTSANDVPSASRFESWEVGYNHYHNRAGLPMTKTGTLIENEIRPNAQRAVWNLAHETLTHANLPASVSPLGGPLPPVLTGLKMLPNGAYQFAFTNNTGTPFTVISSTNLSLSPTQWTVVGKPTNNGSGLFLFSTEPLTNDTQRFYRVKSP